MAQWEDLTLDTNDKLAQAPLGTRAPALMGGAWCKVERGWKWNGPDGNGGTFPRPGGDWDGRLRAHNYKGNPVMLSFGTTMRQS